MLELVQVFIELATLFFRVQVLRKFSSFQVEKHIDFLSHAVNNVQLNLPFIFFYFIFHIEVLLV